MSTKSTTPPPAPVNVPCSVTNAATVPASPVAGGPQVTWDGSIVCISGATDYIVGAAGVMEIMNGHPAMTRVTGLGCTASALCGAFASVNKDFAAATAQAMAVMGIAGELGMEKAAGPGSLQVHFLDALYNLSEEPIARLLKTNARE